MPMNGHSRLSHDLRRGQLLQLRLDPAEGSEQGGVRPVVVVSSQHVNDRSPVIVVASLTTKKTERVYPFEVLVEAGEGGLLQRSKIMFMQLRSVDKGRIVGSYGMVSGQTLRKMDAALKIAVGLEKI